MSTAAQPSTDRRTRAPLSARNKELIEVALATGWYSPEYRRCGKSTCKCATTDYRHGPYYYVSYRDDQGRPRKKYSGSRRTLKSPDPQVERSVTSHRRQYDVEKRRWSTAELAAFFAISQRFMQKEIKERIKKKKIHAEGGRGRRSRWDWSNYLVPREEVERLVEDLPPLLPLKALRKIQDRHPKTRIERRLCQRAVESERRLWEGRARQRWERVKRSVYEDVELLLDERTTVMEWGYIARSGVWILVSLDPCPLCDQRMDVSPKSTAREQATVLRPHLLSTHPLEEPLAQ